jgi:hypothetical protein
MGLKGFSQYLLLLGPTIILHLSRDLRSHDKEVVRSYSPMYSLGK